LAWAEKLPGYDKVFGVGINPKKMAGRTPGSVSSGGQAISMIILAE
jgi:hypothetical protein